MLKTIKIHSDVYSQLLERKSQIISKEEKNITFSEILRRLLK